MQISAEQLPIGQNEAPRAEQAPTQLTPFPQVAISMVLSGWQQVAGRDWLRFVNTLSKKSTGALPVKQK